MIKPLLNLLFPDICPICKGKSDLNETNPFCSNCWMRISPYQGPRCGVCGIPTTSNHTSICADCLDKKPYYEKIYFYGLYDSTLKEVIHFLKYHSIMRLAFQIANLISNLEIPEDVDLITPVPLHKKRLVDRGFNQSANISYHFSRFKGVKYEGDIIKRLVNTPPQSLMHRQERIKNVKDKFIVKKDVQNKSIVVFDDVVTTTATVNECAKVLKKSGAKSVYIVAVARSSFG